jgi:mannosyl-oligosaccharide alpha-1,2-mannosidase
VVGVSTPGEASAIFYLRTGIADNYSTDADANDHRPSPSVVLAVLGTLQLEFTRLSQLTGNPKYYAAVQNVMDELGKWQNETALPGMWPAMVDSSFINQSIALGSPVPGGVEQYTLGAMADSAYEYLPKVYNRFSHRSGAYSNIFAAIYDVGWGIPAGSNTLREFYRDG